MCKKKSTLHSCGHQGAVSTDLCETAILRLNPSLNAEAATFDAACSVQPKIDDRDYCCDRKCCSRQVKVTYDAYRKAGSAKWDFPEPSFMQRSMTGKPKPSYLAKKEEVMAAFLKAQAEHNAAQEEHKPCRIKQEEASAKRRAELDGAKPGGAEQEKKKPSREELEQQKAERAMRRRFGEVLEPDERKDSYFPQMPKNADASGAATPTSTRRRPPPPPPIISYGARQEGHEYVREWLPRVGPGSWSEHSRGRHPSSATNKSGSNGSATQSSHDSPAMNASESNTSATQYSIPSSATNEPASIQSAAQDSHASPAIGASDNPFADEHRGCIADEPGVVRPRSD